MYSNRHRYSPEEGPQRKLRKPSPPNAKHSSSKMTSKRNRSALLAVSLLLIAQAPKETSSFSAPRHAFYNRPSRAGPIIDRENQRTGVRSRTAVTSAGRTISGTATATTQLAGHLAYLDSLHSIASNPELFPATSNFILRLEEHSPENGNAATK